jgi:predicted ATP-binding protein involved in virulence
MGVDSVLFYNVIFSFLHFIYIYKEYLEKQNIKNFIQKIRSLINETNFILDSLFENAKKIVFNTNDIEFDKHLESRVEIFIKFFKYIKSIQTNFSVNLDGDTFYQYKCNIDENKKMVDIIQNTYYLLYHNVNFISNFFIDYISYDFWYMDKNKIILRYKDLSNGEKTILSVITDIVYYVNNHKEAKIILFDEIDETLHPEWKRKLVDILFCIFKKLQKNLHIIFTTHSPFILSDIPKENIIFLKDGKNISDEVDINTFGVNIHILLSHGFFMENGLMGEFANNKINAVIKFLNNKDSEIKSKKEAQNIINMIGESLIKNQLQKMLDSKRLDKIEEIEKEIELLKHRLEILRKNS